MHGETSRCWSDAGLTPLKPLAAATSVPARSFHLDDRGQIAPGKRADLLLVKGRSHHGHLKQPRNIISVWKLGVADDRESYRSDAGKEKQAAATLAQAPAPAGSESGLISDFRRKAALPTAKFGSGWDDFHGQHSRRSIHGADEIIAGGARAAKALSKLTDTLVEIESHGAAPCSFLVRRPLTPVNLSSKKTITSGPAGDGRGYRVMVYTQTTVTSRRCRSFVPARNGPR